nr:MAG TPA: hypothetical protein [Caudoviricetes sp.]
MFISQINSPLIESQLPPEIVNSSLFQTVLLSCDDLARKKMYSDGVKALSA